MVICCVVIVWVVICCAMNCVVVVLGDCSRLLAKQVASSDDQKAEDQGEPSLDCLRSVARSLREETHLYLENVRKDLVALLFDCSQAVTQ